MVELTAAIIGLGGTGERHLRCWANIGGVRVAALYDPDAARVTSAAMEMDGTAAFVNLPDLLAAEPFDIVDVCLPAPQRYAAVENALRFGSHVLCGVPFAMSEPSSQTLVELADHRERLLMPAFPLCFEPLVQFAKEIIENDDIGSPVLFRCHLSGGFVHPDADTDRHGILLDTALHGVALFHTLCGGASAVSGKTLHALPNSQADDTAVITLEGNGMLGVITASENPIAPRNTLEIEGTAGACLLDFDAMTARYLTADQPVWRTYSAEPPGQTERMLAHFADAIRGLHPPALTAKDGQRILSLTLQAANER